MFPKLPKEALQVIGAVDAAGGRGYLVGGALRDLMRGARPEDWDFAATLPPEKLLRIFAGSRLTGGACGTVSAPMAGGRCEITPCRSEGDYGDGRHPGRVDFVPDILADLSRRDFTVNAMACDGRVLFDPFGGQRDLQKRVLRCVGDARARFAEDALRVLRLYRLAAQLGFTAEWNTFCAAGDAIEGLAALPGERVAGEVRRTLMSDGPQVLGGLIAKGGLRSFGFAFAPALHALAGTPRVFLCRLWALAALCGADAARAGAAFGLARKTAAALAEYTRLYRMGPAAGSTALKMKLSQTQLDYAPVAATFAAVSPAFAAEPALYAAVRANKEPYRICHLAVDGGMLYREGIRGEQCGQVLNELLLAVIKYPSLNKPPVLLGLARGLKKLL